MPEANVPAAAKAGPSGVTPEQVERTRTKLQERVDSYYFGRWFDDLARREREATAALDALVRFEWLDGWTDGWGAGRSELDRYDDELEAIIRETLGEDA